MGERERESREADAESSFAGITSRHEAQAARNVAARHLARRAASSTSCAPLYTGAYFITACILVYLYIIRVLVLLISLSISNLPRYKYSYNGVSISRRNRSTLWMHIVQKSPVHLGRQGGLEAAIDRTRELFAYPSARDEQKTHTYTETDRGIYRACRPTRRILHTFDRQQQCSVLRVAGSLFRSMSS